jgi:hypothetical protein
MKCITNFTQTTVLKPSFVEFDIVSPKPPRNSSLFIMEGKQSNDGALFVSLLLSYVNMRHLPAIIMSGKCRQFILKIVTFPPPSKFGNMGKNERKAQ